MSHIEDSGCTSLESEFDLWNLYEDGRRERTPESSPLNSIFVPYHEFIHTCVLVHVHVLSLYISLHMLYVM